MTISFGKVAYTSDKKTNPIDVCIELKTMAKVTHWETLKPLTNQPVFTASGKIWNSRRTDCESCGQNIDTLCELQPGNKKLQRIREIWETYHLNDLQAGTKKQKEYLDSLKATGWKYEYTKACNVLEAVGLLEDRGYKYGHGWLYKPIPAEILEEIKALMN